jgi:hypothetical protein
MKNTSSTLKNYWDGNSKCIAITEQMQKECIGFKPITQLDSIHIMKDIFCVYCNLDGICSYLKIIKNNKNIKEIKF